MKEAQQLFALIQHPENVSMLIEAFKQRFERSIVEVADNDQTRPAKAATAAAPATAQEQLLQKHAPANQIQTRNEAQNSPLARHDQSTDIHHELANLTALWKKLQDDMTVLRRKKNYHMSRTADAVEGIKGLQKQINVCMMQIDKLKTGNQSAPVQSALMTTTTDAAPLASAFAPVPPAPAVSLPPPRESSELQHPFHLNINRSPSLAPYIPLPTEYQQYLNNNTCTISYSESLTAPTQSCSVGRAGTVSGVRTGPSSIEEDTLLEELRSKILQCIVRLQHQNLSSQQLAEIAAVLTIVSSTTRPDMASGDAHQALQGVAWMLEQIERQGSDNGDVGGENVSVGNKRARERVGEVSW